MNQLTTDRRKAHHVTASPATFTEFEKLAQQYGLTNKALLAAMVQYFAITKADPATPKPTIRPTPSRLLIDG